MGTIIIRLYLFFRGKQGGLGLSLDIIISFLYFGMFMR